MSNPNPFVPKGSLLEQQTIRRSRLKIAVTCVLAVGITSLVAVLIQGCKRDTSTDLNPVPPPDVNTYAPDNSDQTNPPMVEAPTNMPMPVPSNTVPVPAPLPPIAPPVAVTPPPLAPAPIAPVVNLAGSTEYTIVRGDTLGHIARVHHVSLKALMAANPGVDARHLRVKQKIVIPAGHSSVEETSSAGSSGGAFYTVKSGDNLTKIAAKFHVSVKAIQAVNHLKTTRIYAGKKLKIPAKGARRAPAPPLDTMPAPSATSSAAPLPAPEEPANP